MDRADRVGVPDINYGNTLHSRYRTCNHWVQARLPWSRTFLRHRERSDTMNTKAKIMFAAMFFSLFAFVVFIAVALGQSAATVDIKSKEGVGSYLADSKGMALYYYKMDSAGKSMCAGGCAERWPVFYADKVTVPAGLKAEDFGTITRDDGKKQTTYKGMPLYYFAGDKNPGDTNGQNVYNVWFVMAP